MAKKNKKKNELSHYPRVFFSKLIFKTVSWIIFAVLFISLGKKYLGTIILGKIWELICGESKSFNQYFLGGDEMAEKNMILNYAIVFVVAIVILNIISLLFNRYLWKKDKYIENNKFYLHNKWLFIINSLIHIASACLLTLSFVSPLTVILALLFITFNSLETFPRQKKGLKSPQTESFFSWKNQYVRKIVLYSSVVIFIAPLIIGRFQAFHKKAVEGSPEGLFAKVYQDFINSSLAVRRFMGLIAEANYSLFHWFILLLFVRGIINKRPKEFTDFWTQVNGIEKRVSNFKCFYHYQESWALSNNKSINLGDYKYLENSPNFLRKDYLAGDLDTNNYAQRNREVVKYIGFCEQKIKETPERNFLNYCLFNKFNSWEDCLRTKRLIKATRK